MDYQIVLRLDISGTGYTTPVFVSGDKNNKTVIKHDPSVISLPCQNGKLLGPFLDEFKSRHPTTFIKLTLRERRCPSVCKCECVSE